VPGGLLEASDVLILAARVLLMALFVITGWQKLANFHGTVAYMASTGAPVPTLSAAVSVAMELFVGIAIVLGIFTRPLALLFCAFTLGTALIGHRYWKLQGAERHANMLNFYKNLSIMGGLLLLAITGPGRYALMPS
jgi:putative oxidoreductase